MFFPRETYALTHNPVAGLVTPGLNRVGMYNPSTGMIPRAIAELADVGRPIVLLF